MKKLYTTLALAAAVALSASAADVKALKFEKNVQTISNEISVEEFAAPIARKVAPAVMKAQPTSVEDILGYYEIAYVDLYKDGNDFSLGAIKILKGSGANEVNLYGFGNSKDDNPIVGVFNAAAGTLSIASYQPVFTTASLGQIYWQHVIVAEVNGQKNFAISKDPLVLTFDDKGNFVVPFQNGWPEGCFLGAKDSPNFEGYWAGMIAESRKMTAPAAEGWSDAGNATLSDPWFLPGVGAIFFTTAPNFPAYDVKLQRNQANPNLYRLYDPYANINEYLNGDTPTTSEDYFPFNESVLAGCIEFDVTDPTCVLFTPQVYSGLSSDDLFGMDMFYMTNGAGDFVLTESEYTEGMSTAEKIELWKTVLQEGGEQDNISTYVKEANTVIIKDAQFYASGQTTYPNWTTLLTFLKENNPDVWGTIQLPVVMQGAIVMPDPAGIDNIITDNTNKTLEYFNLQGVRVENPSNGIYIRRQGNDVQKVYVR